MGPLHVNCSSFYIKPHATVTRVNCSLKVPTSRSVESIVHGQFEPTKLLVEIIQYP